METNLTRSASPCRPLASSQRRGSTLITAVICIMLLETLGAAVMALSMTGLRLSEHVRRGTVAFNLAESAGSRATRWLKDTASPPTSATDPFGGTQTLGDGTYSATVTPDAGNAGATLKRYIVLANGTVQGRLRQVKLILRESSFGKYAYFTDKEVNSLGNRIWFMSRDRIRGPAHSNNSDGNTFQVSWTSGGPPIFQGMVTTAASSINYATTPVSEADYLSIYLTGSRGFHLGVDPVPLPASNSKQQNAAWGASSGFPTTDGVTVPNAGGLSTGGIYIHGDATIHMQLDASNNQQFVVTQGATITTITVDRANNQIKQQIGSGTVTSYTGTGNGMLFCTGNVTSLDGTVADNRLDTSTPPNILSRSAYTICADVANDKNITLTNPITYKSAPDTTLPTTDPTNLKPGTLGLLGRNITVADTAPTNMEIDAQILAGRDSGTFPGDTDGSFSVQNWGSKAPGTLKLVGGLIQRARGIVGTFSGSTIVSGYAKDYYYDPRMADNPPPFFPTTGNYDLISWQKLAG